MTAAPILPSAAWALEPTALGNLMDRLKPEALMHKRPFKASRGERLGVLEGVGTLEIAGPLFKRDSFITHLFGFTTYSRLRRDLQAALDDDRISAIALHVDSPGGEVNGCNELAQAVYEARKKKPITAYISGMGCSAAYWIASAAEKVVVENSAIVGSIGVALAVSPGDDPNTVQFVSSNAPGKRPDATTERGRAQHQKMVDDLADVFVAHVARNRGTTKATVERKFGQGGVEIGKKAVAAGMADRIGLWEDVLASLRKSSISHRANARNLAISSSYAPPLALASRAIAAPVPLSKAEAARAQAEAAAVARVQAICRSKEGAADPDFAAELAMNTEISAGEAIEKLRERAAELAKAKAQSQLKASWKRMADRIANLN